jgi:Protein of unknown function (DUF3489)
MGAPPADVGAEAIDAAAPATGADSAAARGKRKVRASARPGKAAPAERPTPRTGTKQAQMIEMLERPEGATVPRPPTAPALARFEGTDC